MDKMVPDKGPADKAFAPGTRAELQLDILRVAVWTMGFLLGIAVLLSVWEGVQDWCSVSPWRKTNCCLTRKKSRTDCCGIGGLKGRRFGSIMYRRGAVLSHKQVPALAHRSLQTWRCLQTMKTNEMQQAPLGRRNLIIRSVVI